MQDGGCYDLFVGPNNVTSDTSISAKQGNASAVCFTARNRFAVLQSGGSVGIYNLQNELSKKFDPPVSTDYIFPGPEGSRLRVSGQDRRFAGRLTLISQSTGL